MKSIGTFLPTMVGDKRLSPTQCMNRQTLSMFLRNAWSKIMPSCSPHLCKDERSVFSLILFTTLAYFLIMDIILYVTLQNTPTLTVPKLPADGHYSMFLPLTVKLIMSDHLSHYFMNPTIEYFQDVTKFNTVFYFITPNMISFTHLFLALIAAKFVSSENLNTRRIGCVLYTIRTWLDCLDGSVHRTRLGKKRLYNSERLSTGYYVDVVCDTMGGAFLSFGVLFYFYKVLDSKAKELPYSKLGDGNGNGNGNGPANIVQYTKCQLFWKMWCVGFMVGVAAATWDYTIDQFKSVFQTKLANQGLESLQSSYLHAFSTWIIMWLWRFCEGQVALQYVLIALFIDKIWEYVNFIQYIGYVIILTLFVISILYIKHVKTALFL